MKGLSCNLKKILLTVSLLVLPCLLGLSSLFTQSASAIDYDPEVRGNGHISNSTCNYTYVNRITALHSDATWYCWPVPPNEGKANHLGSGDLYFDLTIPKGSLLTLQVKYDGFGVMNSQMSSFVFSNGGHLVDQQVVPDVWWEAKDPALVGGENVYGYVNVVAQTYNILTVLITEDTNSLHWNVPYDLSVWTSVDFSETVSYIGLADINKSMQDVNNSIDSGNKAEQDRWEQDKQEEQNREDSSKDEGNKLAGIFNISLLNPFAGIWEIFNPGGCTSIPTIASWVHSEDTQYCSWWPQSIRATLTPVFSLAAMVLLFGFVVRWLGGGEGAGTIRVSGLSKGVY